jgi:hypothetical protein
MAESREVVIAVAIEIVGMPFRHLAFTVFAARLEMK